MVRLRNAVMVFVLATGLTGCSSGHWPSIAHWSIWHCDSCDDFPTPAYGPGYSMMPGTYTGPPTLGIEWLRATRCLDAACRQCRHDASCAGRDDTTPPSPPTP